MNSLSSHVLDTTNGGPVSSLTLIITSPQGETHEVVTDADGRCNSWGDIQIGAGQYRLRFMTGDYLMETHGKAFYPFVDIHFEIAEDGGHYHVPLLLSPFGFSSYRGS